ncbi:CP2J2 protein, partial [Atractosteus spatula]|nr:CP2J2 protein [Atractosteus spatula]
ISVFHFILEGLDAQSILLFLAVFLLITDIVKNKNPKNFPPGPWGLPILGNVFNIDTKQTHIYMGKLAENYGDVSSMRLGREKIVFVTGYQLVKEALVNQREAFADRPTVCSSPLGDAVYGGFGKRLLYTVPINIACVLVSLPSCYPVHYTVYGYEIPGVQRSNPSWDATRLKSPGRGKTRTDKTWRSKAAGFHEENLVLCSLDLFIAGTETTTISLCWAFLYLIKYPDIQKKVQAEIDRVIGKERQPSMADRHIPVCSLHPSQLYSYIQYNIQYIQFNDSFGKEILNQCHQIRCLTSVHTFNPGHFLDSEGKFVRREAFIPFSAGKKLF